MIISTAKQAQTSTGVLYNGGRGTTLIALQNHDASNPVVVTLGGPDAILSPSNGMTILAGEFGELKGNAGDFAGILTFISGTGAVDCTFFHN